MPTKEQMREKFLLEHPDYAKHRTYKTNWQRRKRAGLIPPNLHPHHKKCCWCGYEKERIFCSGKCREQFEKFGGP
jgi:hypothetical protein